MNIPAGSDQTALGAAEAAALARSIRIVNAAQFHSFAPVEPQYVTAAGWLLELVVEGALCVQPDRGERRLRPAGGGMLYAPGCRFAESSAEPAAPSEYKSLYVIFADESNTLGSLLGGLDGLLRLEDASAALTGRLSEVVNGFNGGAAAVLAATGGLLKILSLLVAAERRRDTLIVEAGPDATSELVAAVHACMRENISRPLRIAELADHVGLSESALSHAYKRITGRTPMQAMRAMRIEAVRAHLLRGTLTLETIAELTGFADAFHLSRSFRRAVGITPSAFRRTGGRGEP